MSESKQKFTGDGNYNRDKSEEAGHFPASIVGSPEDSVVSVDFNIAVTGWNEGAERLYGYPASEVIGKPLTLLTLSRDLKELLNNIKSVRDGDAVKVYETERVHKDGRHINLLVTLSPVKDDSGQIIGVSFVARDITRNKTAVEKLSASEDRYRTLFNSIDQGFCIIEMLFDENEKAIDYRFIEVNPVFEKMTGVPNNEALGEKTARQLIPNLEDKWVEIYGKVALTGESVRFEEGSEAMRRWFDVYGFRIDGEESRKVALLFNDISRRKLAEEKLRQSDDRLRLAVDISQTATFEINLLTDAVDTDDIGREIYGFEKDAPLTFARVQSHFHPDDRDDVLRNVSAALAPEGSDEFEVEQRIIRTNGETRWIRVRGRAFFEGANESKRAVRCLGTYIDITERKQVEQEREQLLEQLETERSRLAYLFAKAPAFVAVVSGPEHTFEMTNPAYLQLIGHRNVVGKPVRQALPEVEGQGFFEILDDVFRTGEPFIGKELPIEIQREPNSAPEERFVDFVYQPIFEADKSVSGIFAHGVDITEQVEARRQAEFANRLKDEFLATLSHELRTPLNAILGWSQMLQTHRLGESETKKALMTIERNARAQNQLIDDLLDVSRIITGKLRLDVRAVDLSSVITAAADAARPAAEAKNIRLQTLLDPQAGAISGDPDRLQQVVWNLLSNAVKFTPRDGRVQVRLERVDSHVEIIISDTGKGIEAEFLPHVFDRFRQSDGSMTRRHGGLGLGLAIVRELVELHGGSVSASSAGEEQGSTFTVSVPLLPVRTEPAGGVPRVHPAAEEIGVPQECPPELSGLRVLLVEDEADSRELLNLVLGACGAQITTASSAAESFETIKRERFDVVISDIGMPEEDGFSLIGKIRELSNEEGGDVPAIALTAYARAEDRVQALRAGFQMHVAKPVEPGELLAVVANLAERMRNPQMKANGEYFKNKK
jgi:PAS domain S-box-containing protein